jgi:hypothetical protein
MTLQLSAYVETSLLPVIYKGQACPAAPVAHQLRLYSAAPSDAGGGTELSGGGYAPMALAGLLASPIASGDDIVVTNTARIESAAATTDWLEATHWGITAGDGTLLAHGAVGSPQSITTGVHWVCDVGQLELRLAGGLSSVLKTAVLNWVLFGTAITPRTASLIALYTAGGEVPTSGTGYSRAALSLGAVTDLGDGQHATANDADIEWTATADWGTVTEWSALTSGGEVLTRAAWNSARTYPSGSIASIAAGAAELVLG